MRSAQFSIFPSCILHGNTAFIRLFKILTAKRTLQSKSFILATFTSKPFGSKLWNLPPMLREREYKSHISYDCHCATVQHVFVGGTLLHYTQCHWVFENECNNKPAVQELAPELRRKSWLFRQASLL